RGVRLDETEQRLVELRREPRRRDRRCERDHGALLIAREPFDQPLAQPGIVAAQLGDPRACERDDAIRRRRSKRPRRRSCRTWAGGRRLSSDGGGGAAGRRWRAVVTCSTIAFARAWISPSPARTYEMSGA